MINAFENSKYSKHTNALDWVREMPLKAFGIVLEVLDETHVRCAYLVQDTPSISQVVDVTLVNLSSAALTISAQPQKNDLVLMFSPQRMHKNMFDDPTTREHPTLYDTGGSGGYCSSAMLGMLVNMFKSSSGVEVRVSVDETGLPTTVLMNSGSMYVSHLGSVGVVFYTIGTDDIPVVLTINPHRPTTINLRSALNIIAGVEDDEDETTLDAPINITLSEKAPFTLASDAVVDISSTDVVNIHSDDSVNFTTDGLTKLGNQIATLGEILNEYNDILAQFDTVGSPASHMTGPGAAAKLAALRNKQNEVFN